MSKKSLTLIEVVVSMALLVLVALGMGAAFSASLNASRDAKPSFIAQEAGQRLLEELRNRDFTSLHDTFWGEGVVKKTIDGTPWTTSDLQGGMQQIADEHLVPALDQGILRASTTGDPRANGDPLRLRFVGEAEFHALWGTTLDLDFPEDIRVKEEVQPTQRVFPVLIQVHYGDARGDRVYQLAALVHEEAPLDRTP
jgi:type II secretory pathway pseudopilin PulG